MTPTPQDHEAAARKIARKLHDDFLAPCPHDERGPKETRGRDSESCHWCSRVALAFAAALSEEVRVAVEKEREACAQIAGRFVERGQIGPDIASVIRLRSDAQATPAPKRQTEIVEIMHATVPMHACGWMTRERCRCSICQIAQCDACLTAPPKAGEEREG